MITKAAQERDLDTFVQEVVAGKISASMYREASKIYPLKRVEVRKIKVLKYPEQEVQQAQPSMEAAEA